MLKVEEKKFYNCSNDKVFKRMMQSKNGKLYLEAILSTILKTSAKIVEFLNVELPGETKDEKEKRVDLLVETENGYVNVEINNNDYDEVKRLRNFIYLCNYFSQQVKSGEEYKTDVNFVQLNFNFGPSFSNRAITTGRMINEDGIMFDNFTMKEINIENLKDMCYNNHELEEEYKYVLIMDMNEDNLSEYSKKDPLIKKYGEDLMKINSDKKFVALLSAEEDEKMLYKTRISLSYKNGIKDGIEQGVEQEKIETVKKFYELGIPLETIAKGTNLSVAEVKKILEE